MGDQPDTAKHEKVLYKTSSEAQHDLEVGSTTLIRNGSMIVFMAPLGNHNQARLQLLEMRSS